MRIQESNQMFYSLSDQLLNEKTAIFAIAISFVIGGSEGYFRPGKVANDMQKLLQGDGAFDTQYQTEVGCWRGRSTDIQSCDYINDEMYFAWVDPDGWDYKPHLAIFTQTQFRQLLLDCCLNFCAEHPECAAEFSAAIVAKKLKPFV